MTLAFNSLNIYSLCLVVHVLNSFAFIYLFICFYYYLLFFCGNLEIILLPRRFANHPARILVSFVSSFFF